MKTEPIDKSLSQIQLLNNAEIDCGTEQGQDAFFEQLRNHSPTYKLLNSSFDWYVAETNQCIEQVQDMIKPYSLPADYLYFLKNYGGMNISDKNFYFTSLGFGPMVEEWYSYLMGDEGIYENGFLKIGFLKFRKSDEDPWKYTYYFLDLGNTVQRDSIIEVFGWKLGESDFQDILKKPESHLPSWLKVADSFTRWLEIAATTSGSFGYRKS